jgi:hypothetical protein
MLIWSEGDGEIAEIYNFLDIEGGLRLWKHEGFRDIDDYADLLG